MSIFLSLFLGGDFTLLFYQIKHFTNSGAILDGEATTVQIEDRRGREKSNAGRAGDVAASANEARSHLKINS